MNKIMRVFLETNLACSHLGLSEIAKKAKIDVKTIDPVGFIIFLNKAKTAFKLFASNNVIVYYRAPSGRLDLNTIKFLPYVFNAKEMSVDMRTAQKLALKDRVDRQALKP